MKHFQLSTPGLNVLLLVKSFKNIQTSLRSNIIFWLIKILFRVLSVGGTIYLYLRLTLSWILIKQIIHRWQSFTSSSLKILCWKQIAFIPGLVLILKALTICYASSFESEVDETSHFWSLIPSGNLRLPPFLPLTHRMELIIWFRKPLPTPGLKANIKLAGVSLAKLWIYIMFGLQVC